MCGDPITRFNGKSIQFWIPLDTDIKLITVDSLTLFGMARKRTSLRSMQWFSDFTLQYNGDTVLHIGCKNIVSMGMAKIAAMAPPAKLGAGVPMRFLDLTSMDEEGEKKVNVAGIYHLAHSMLIADVKHDNRYLAYKLNKEAVFIRESAQPDKPVLEFFAAKANKFTDMKKQLQHLHLDMNFGDISKRTIGNGILPQLWGLQARTPEVMKMLHKPY